MRTGGLATGVPAALELALLGIVQPLIMRRGMLLEDMPGAEGPADTVIHLGGMQLDSTVGITILDAQSE
jgi:hypothetical protein